MQRTNKSFLVFFSSFLIYENCLYKPVAGKLISNGNYVTACNSGEARNFNVSGPW